MATEVTAPLGMVGRADLLRALAVAPRDYLALENNAQGWFGYVREAPEQRPEPLTLDASATQPETPPERGTELPLKMPFVYAEVQREYLAPSAAQPLSAPAQVKPIDEALAQAPSAQCLIRYEDLVPQARLLPALRRFLSTLRPGALDIAQLTQQLAERNLPRHLPRLKRRRWHPDVVVLLDFSPRLWPYREDMHRLAERMQQHCGRSAVSLRVVKHGALGPWSDWRAYQNGQSDEPLLHPWAPPRAGTPLLIASDLGLLLGADSAACQDWRSFIAAQTRSGVRPVALAPLGAAQLDAQLTQALPVLRWSADAPLRPARVHAPACAVPPGLDDLLAMAAATRRVDPPLLRAMRKLNPHAPLNAGLEGALWVHADVEAGTAASIRPAAREAHLQRFGALQAHLHIALNQLRSNHHAHLRAVLNHEETLLWESYASTEAVNSSPDIQQQIRDAEKFFEHLAATLSQDTSDEYTARWRHVAQDIYMRADASMVQKHGNLLAPLVKAQVRRDDDIGKPPAVPAWVTPAMLSAWRKEREVRDPVPCWIVVDAARGGVVLQSTPAAARQSALGDALLLDAGGARAQVGKSSRWRTLHLPDLPVRLSRFDDACELRIETAREMRLVAPVQRPRGIAGWSVHPGGARVTAAPLAVYQAHWPSAELQAVRAKPVADERTPTYTFEAIPVTPTAVQTTVTFGIDAEFGAWADLTLAARKGEVTQRLRWIEPGEFMMGSPAGELEYSDEGPQHRVTLSEGYWLADSACTQALWEAVMGNNPSHFKNDAQHPVEQVSWDDVQTFLRKLEQLMPGIEAKLPTEAQWEYACRAGTKTPFSFGENISPEQVNYDGNEPYLKGEKGLYRQQTVAVKSLPPNKWGLYEMHGNVWEWCADGLRDYSKEPQRDPEGPLSGGKGAHRALRGGSWFDFAGWARSAFRFAYPPGIANHVLGFRLSLRSIEPGQDQGR